MRLALDPQTLLSASGSSLGRMAPFVIVAVMSVLLLLADLCVPSRRRALLAWLSFAGYAAAAAVQLVALPQMQNLINSVIAWDPRGSAFNGSVRIDTFSEDFTLLLLVLAALVMMAAPGYLDRRGLHHGEFYALVAGSVAGMILLVSAANLIVIFLAIEVLSVALYVLTGFDRRDHLSQEAAMKYLIVGGFASAFILYGLALLYGAAASTSLAAVAGAAQAASQNGGGQLFLVLTGTALVMVGFAFKTSTAPFHQWTPDVYEGAPTMVTAFMSVGTKVAAFAVFLRVFYTALLPLLDHWAVVIAVLAYITIAVGNLLALWQRRLKRMLAYSGIAHAGYLLLGLLGTRSGVTAIVFYSVAYLLMNLGAFVVVAALARGGRDADDYDALQGLGWEHPWMAAAMSLFMLSLAGFPLTIGFIGKLLLFQAALQAGWSNVVVWAAVFSVVSAYYYLRVIWLMYSARAEGADPVPQATAGLSAAMALTALGTLLLGVFPNGLVSLAQAGALDLLH